MVVGVIIAGAGDLVVAGGCVTGAEVVGDVVTGGVWVVEVPSPLPRHAALKTSMHKMMTRCLIILPDLNLASMI